MMILYVLIAIAAAVLCAVCLNGSGVSQHSPKAHIGFTLTPPITVTVNVIHEDGTEKTVFQDDAQTEWKSYLGYTETFTLARVSFYVNALVDTIGKRITIYRNEIHGKELTRIEMYVENVSGNDGLVVIHGISPEGVSCARDFLSRNGRSWQDVIAKAEAQGLNAGYIYKRALDEIQDARLRVYEAERERKRQDRERMVSELLGLGDDSVQADKPLLN